MKAKQVLGFAWREFVYGGHLLSLGAVSIVFTSAVLLDILIAWDFLLVVYLITYTVYLYNRFKEFNEDFLTNPDRTQHVKRYINRIPFIISCSVLIIIGILLHFGNFLSLVFGLLLLLLGMLYSVCFKKLTRKIVGFKSFYVSFIWASLVIFLAFYYSFSLNLATFFIFFFIFLRWLINSIFFDIKDTKLDKKDYLKTLPVLLGKMKVLSYLHIINIFSIVPIIIGVFKNLLPPYALFLLIFYFYSFYYLQKVKDEKANVHNLSYVMVDGEYLLWLTILFFK